MVVSEEAKNTVILDMCRAFKQDNPNFKPHLFIKACGADEKLLLAI